MKKKTVGEIATDLQQKNPDTRDPRELEQEMHKDYEDNIYACCERGKRDLPNKDFYIIIETKKERLLNNVIRNFFFYRISCPTPNYDQTVYQYKYKEDKIEFLWVVPSKDTCEIFKNHVLEVVPNERQLLRYILDFEDGTLLKISKRLNGECDDNILINK